MKTLILICALGLARADCSTETAVAVIQGPEAGMPGQCGLYGQAYLADTALRDYLDGEHYLKIRCSMGNHPRPRPLEASRTAPQDVALSEQHR